MKKNVVLMAALMLMIGGMSYAQEPEKQDSTMKETPVLPEPVKTPVPEEPTVPEEPESPESPENPDSPAEPAPATPDEANAPA